MMTKLKFLGEGGIFLGFHSAQIRKPQGFQLLLPNTPMQAFPRCILFHIIQYAASAANPSDMTLGQTSPKTPELHDFKKNILYERPFLLATWWAHIWDGSAWSVKEPSFL